MNAPEDLSRRLWQARTLAESIMDMAADVAVHVRELQALVGEGNADATMLERPGLTTEVLLGDARELDKVLRGTYDDWRDLERAAEALEEGL